MSYLNETESDAAVLLTQVIEMMGLGQSDEVLLAQTTRLLRIRTEAARLHLIEQEDNT